MATTSTAHTASDAVLGIRLFHVTKISEGLRTMRTSFFKTRITEHGIRSVNSSKSTPFKSTSGYAQELLRHREDWTLELGEKVAEVVAYAIHDGIVGGRRRFCV